jgi:hypothetical protein
MTCLKCVLKIYELILKHSKRILNDKNIQSDIEPEHGFQRIDRYNYFGQKQY